MLNPLFKTDNKILLLLKFLLAAPLLLPLFISSSFLFPYTSIKAFLFRIIIEIAAVLYLYLALRYHFFLPSFRKKGESILNLAILAFFIVSFLSAVFGLDFFQSFWGDLERMNGVWNLAHFVAWFLMLFSPLLRGSASWRRGDLRNNIFFHQLLRLSVAVSSLVALLAILQRFASLGLLLPQAGRVFSTIGNPAFLGTYLLFNIFFAGYLLLSGNPSTRPAAAGLAQGVKSLSPERSEAKSKASWLYFSLYSLSIILNLIALLLTGTRGAILGLAAGAVIFLALLELAPLIKGVRQPPTGGGGRGFKKWPIIFLAAIIIFAGALFLSRGTAFVRNNSFLSRLTSISLGDASTQSRLILWQDAWRAWQARPILGSGPENFETAISPYLSPKLAGYEAYSFDRAHNFIFDYGVATGWLGLLAYSGIFAAAGWRLIKNIKDDYYFSIIFLSLLAAYLIQNLFVFDTFISYLMLFFALGIINIMPLRSVERQSNSVDGDKNTGSPRPFGARDDKIDFYKKIVFAIFIIFIIFSLYAFNLKPLRASYLANQTLILPPEALGETGLINLTKILALKTFASPEIIYQITLDYLDKINQAPQLTQDENFYKILSDGLAANISRSPSQPKNYIALAWLNLYFSSRNNERINSAINLGRQAKILSPAKKDAYLILVAGYSMSGQPGLALEIVSQAEIIDGKIGKDVREYWEKIR
ncbi:MAG: hypothetical protein UU87_C0002G0121 [Parcubacteria group bacterium GW2011_GWA2_42_11]|nr:MAG: hypothetical protein UU87_C0002G0121 [Parcubacteria group bacterium GW2011_GWA2_42_11]